MNTTQQLVRFHVGLETPTGPNESQFVGVRRAQALDAFSDAYDAFTVSDVTGLWEGREEPSLVVEVYTDATEAATERARELARTIREDLEQDAVALAVLPVTTFELL